MPDNVDLAVARSYLALAASLALKAANIASAVATNSSNKRLAEEVERDGDLVHARLKRYGDW